LRKKPEGKIVLSPIKGYSNLKKYTIGKSAKTIEE
jgi:hypothetical protein